MNDRIREAFDQVQAGEELKEKTRECLTGKIQGYTKRRINRYPYLASVTVCLLFLMFGGHWFYFTPTAKISIDVNPSLELGINRFDRVVVVEAYNEDGRELAASLNIRFMGYREAVNQILENERIVDLLSQDEIMTITVMESKGTQSVRILSDMESCVAKHQNTYCYSADSREVAPAHRHGMSCGKYRAFLELQKFYPDITPEEIQGMSMREIRNLTDEMLQEKGEQHHGEDTGDEREPYAGNGLEDERQENDGTEREDKETIPSDSHHRHRHRGTGNKHGSFMKRGAE